MASFYVRVYDNYLRGNGLVADWSNYVSGVNFGTSAIGGFSTCTFNLRLSYKLLYEIVEGSSVRPGYITNRVRITDEKNWVCYEGRIYDLILQNGAQTIARSANELYTVAKLDYFAKQGTRVGAYTDATARGLYGIRVYYRQIDGEFAPQDSRITAMATSFITEHKSPTRSQPKALGGSGEDLFLQVSCVGLGEDLNVRTAWNNSSIGSDTSQIVKDMIQAGPITSGTNSGNGQRGWNERLTADATNNIPYASQFIKSAFGNVNSSGVTVSRNFAQGMYRTDIIKQLCAYGSSGNVRMMFQVWDDGLTNSGQGVPYFRQQSIVRGFATGYSGYYTSAKTNLIKEADNLTVIRPYTVRAGRWMTTTDQELAKAFLPINTPWDDPLMMFIEETHYDVDTATLTLTPSTQFDAERYLGQYIHGRRVIRG